MMGQMFESGEGWATEYDNILTLECITLTYPVEKPFGLQFTMKAGKPLALLGFTTLEQCKAKYWEIIKKKNDSGHAWEL